MRGSFFVRRVAIVGLAVLLGACAVTSKSSTLQTLRPDSVVGPVWEALTLEGSIPLVAPKPTFRWVDSSQIVGSGGCNSFAVQAALEGQTVHLGPLRPQGKPCMTAPSGQEDMFFRALERTRQMGMEGEQLLLLDGRSQVIARFGRKL
nr:META domain-containing protein [Rhodoferax aquaticus]